MGNEFSLGLGKKTSKASSKKSGTNFSSKRESTEISDEAVASIVERVLGGANGLASIFAGEQSAGIFDSSVANQAAGSFAAKLAGQIAELRAVRVTEQEGEFEEIGHTRGKSSDTSLGSTSS